MAAARGQEDRLPRTLPERLCRKNYVGAWQKIPWEGDGLNSHDSAVFQMEGARETQRGLEIIWIIHFAYLLSKKVGFRPACVGALIWGGGE